MNRFDFSQRSFRWIFFVLLMLTLLRVANGFLWPFSLQVDKAQYAGCGHTLDWEYFSEPSLIAWVLRAANETCDILGCQFAF